MQWLAADSLIYSFASHMPFFTLVSVPFKFVFVFRCREWCHLIGLLRGQTLNQWRFVLTNKVSLTSWNHEILWFMMSWCALKKRNPNVPVWWCEGIHVLKGQGGMRKCHICGVWALIYPFWGLTKFLHSLCVILRKLFCLSALQFSHLFKWVIVEFTVHSGEDEIR